MSSRIQPGDEVISELEALQGEVATLRQRLASRSAEAPDADELSYRVLVQSANTIVLRWDLQDRVTFFNDFGYAPDMQALLALADQALFKAKGMGRNTIQAASAVVVPRT